MQFDRGLRKWAVGGIALLSFLVGWLISAHVTHVNEVKAASNRIFELNVYHAVPGKVRSLEARFADGHQLLAKHNLDVIGYWVPNQDPSWNDTFIYIVAGNSQEELEKNWNAFHADPAFQKYLKAEQEEKLIERVDSTYMRPTDYSAMK